jgi:hypothetical protein
MAALVALLQSTLNPPRGGGEGSNITKMSKAEPMDSSVGNELLNIRYGGQSSDSTKTPRAGYGSLAVGALAIGALAVGALAVGALEIRKARLREVEIDDLVVHRFRVVEEPGEESV